MKSTVIVAITLLIKALCDQCVAEFTDRYEDLDSYKFRPKIGKCYEIYGQSEEVTSLICQRPARPRRRSCIHLTLGEKYCFILKTPTEETIQLLCDDSTENIFSYKFNDDLNNCFNVSRPDQIDKEVCQRKFDNYSIGITTPDNFTVLFYSAFCLTSTSNKDKKRYKNFADTFSIDPETERCYKIYQEHQYISPYTCLNKDIFSACLEELPHVKNCKGIVTQNNETVILHCNDDVDLSNRNCFKILTADGNSSTACQERVEERCVGIRTPSNLTLLLECYFCTKSDVNIIQDVEIERSLGTFITTYLSYERFGKNSYSDKPKFKTFYRDIPWSIQKYLQIKSTVYGYWLPDTTCYGITLPNNETVVLECTSGDRIKQSDCFPVMNTEIKNEQEQFVCIEALDQYCIGIVTPMQWSVELACYYEYYNTLTGEPLSSDEQIVEEYPSNDTYRFRPIIGKCHEIYNQSEKVTSLSCQMPLNPEKYSCINLVEGEQYCLNLQTPTNESVEILCEDSEEELLSYHSFDELRTCFNISRPDRSYKEVCQQKFDNSVGITTPDNFTVLLSSDFCSASVDNEERKTYDHFIRAYSFDPKPKRCYKIYERHQEISPYTCLSEEVFSACMEELPYIKNCEGIITQNNETVILQCIDDRQALPNRNCFEIYSADNNLHTACQERVEERCLGIRTPSNLTVLLDCYFCTDPGALFVPDDLKRRRDSWIFVTQYLSDEFSGTHSYLRNLKFAAFRNDKPKRHKEIIYGHWVPNTTCYGITTPSNETVVLECISADSFKRVKSGCFPVIDPITGEDDHIVCSKILDRSCVGITTPMNWSVALACYVQYHRSEYEYLKDWYRNKSVDGYRPYLRINNCYQFYSPEEINPYSCLKGVHGGKYYCTHWIPGKKGCLGLKTPNDETIELACIDSYDQSYPTDSFSTNTKCFDVYGLNGQSQKACLQKFGDYSIGLTTPSNYSVLLDSFFCGVTKSSWEFDQYKEFLDNFVFDPSIRSCYKVYTPDQDVGPYTCLSNEICDACVHQIENTKCKGITTQNNETVILECLNSTLVPQEMECFEIYTSDGKKHRACQKQVEEQCMGITTPSNLTVLLECRICLSTKGGTELRDYSDKNRKIYRPYNEYLLYLFTQNHYALEDKIKLDAYTPEQDIKLIDCFGEIAEYNIHILHNHDGCRGVTLENMETIILGCPNRKPKKAGCFDVFGPVYGENNEIVGPETKIGNVCVRILNEWCVGILTPGNWTIPLRCFYPSSAACSLVSVPDNGPPPRN